MLTVAFHGQLLEISREALEVLVVWQHYDRFTPKKTVVPDRDQPHEHRQVALERRVPEMAIHLMETREHGAEIFRSDREHCERFGTDDEQSFFGIEVSRGFIEVGAIDIGDEAESHIALAVMTQRLVGHYGTEIGAANADVDDVADTAIRMSAPAAAADLFGESRHAIEYRVYLGYDIDAVDKKEFVLLRTEGDMEHRSMFGNVDFLAAEHAFDALRETTYRAQRKKQANLFAGHSFLGVVEIEPGAIHCQPLAAL